MLSYFVFHSFILHGHAVWYTGTSRLFLDHFSQNDLSHRKLTSFENAFEISNQFIQFPNSPVVSSASRGPSARLCSNAHAELLNATRTSNNRLASYCATVESCVCVCNTPAQVGHGPVRGKFFTRTHARTRDRRDRRF